jgi:SOS-response transcriptional repressor LexA
MKTTFKDNLPALQLEEAEKLRAIFEQRRSESARAGSRITQTDVGEACGWNSAQSVMSQLMTGRMALNVEMLIRLAHVLNFSPVEVSPRLAVTIDLVSRLPDSGKLFSAVDGYRIPVISGSIPVTCKGALAQDGGFTPQYENFGLLTIYSADHTAYGLMISGNALMPRIRNGEIAVIEPSRECQAGDEVLVRLKDGQCMLREFIYQRDGQYRFDAIGAGGDPVFVNELVVEAIEYVDAILKRSRFRSVGS